MKRILTILVLLLPSCVILFAQQTSAPNRKLPGTKKGYYMVDSSMIVVMMEVGNKTSRSQSVFIPKQPGHDAVTLYPNQIKGFGSPGWIRYMSAVIEVNGEQKDVFLETMAEVTDSSTIYRHSYNNRYTYYMWANDSLTRAASATQVWNFMGGKNSCTNFHPKQRFPKKLNKSNIKIVSSAYYNCNPNKIRRFRYGITASTGFPGKKYGMPYSAGLFVELPMGIVTAFRPEVEYAFIDSKKNNARDTYILGFLPVRIAFNKTKSKIIPYTEFGLFIRYDLYFHEYDDYLQRWIKEDMGVLFKPGFAAGGGIEYKVGVSNSIYFGGRFYMPPIDHQSDLHLGSFRFVISLSM